MNRLIVMGLLIVFFLGVIFLISKKTPKTQTLDTLSQNQTVQSISPSPISELDEQQNNSSSDLQTLEPPPLMPNVSWVKETGESAMDVINLSDGKSNRTTAVKLSGQSWVYKRTRIPSMEELSKDPVGTELFSYYDTQLVKRGWLYDIESNDVTLSAIRADGGGASQNGYIAYRDGKFRVLSTFQKTTFAKGEFPINQECPCTLEVRIFVSDSIPIDTFIHQN